MITLTAFRWVPPFAQGQVRDLRVRWALEEAGIAYRERLIGTKDQASPEYRALQPFGQVPAIEEGELKLFESGAIVLEIAERSTALMPSDAQGRARARAWTLAALNTLEPPIMQLAALDVFHADQPWAAPARPTAQQAVCKRLDELAAWLGERDYLEDRYTAGDLMMASVLRILHNTTLVADRPTLQAYRDRCEARPAFGKALAAQLRPFAEYEASRASSQRAAG
ncbi:glutathione S-transferase family protein [Bordetella sp. BOR01]|uniref:glutathione S-transferase family protein n=1 Tax=Bordetella sp. BOR01 TaxID=2854779 RepID=UPI001C4947F2|nr:glutathione S-transferase family protein [Bordetella sp. BOR01]MBV7482636.1 glutathione S-transferase family protein [Bordetella sp. BOR01]